MGFVPDDLDGSSWIQIEPYMNDLKDRVLSCSNCLETFIHDRSALSEIISMILGLTFLSIKYLKIMSYRSKTILDHPVLN